MSEQYFSTPANGTAPAQSAAVADTPPSDLKALAKEVSIYYRDKRGNETQALFDISLNIPNQSVVALIGPSGCGKSTLLRCFNRMNELKGNARYTGHILMDGLDIYHPQTDVVELRRRVGMVFQQPNPFPKSIFDNVAYGPRVAGETNRAVLTEIVETSLKRAAVWEEVKDRLRDSALGLSGGQQQRVCIARALATKPELLLMDEPTSALDPNAAERVEALIAELKKSIAIVIVTHNMQQARRASDWTAFLYKGVLIESAPTVQLFESPREEKTIEYVSGRFG